MDLTDKNQADGWEWLKATSHFGPIKTQLISGHDQVFMTDPLALVSKGKEAAILRAAVKSQAANLT